MARTQQQKYEFALRAMACCRRGLVWLAIVILLTFPMLVFVPRLEKYYDDFNRPTPAHIVFVLKLTRWLGGRLYPDQMIPGLFWLIGLLMLLGLAMLWFHRMAKRNAPGLCPNCGYDLTGTLAAGLAQCPECGRGFNP